MLTPPGPTRSPTMMRTMPATIPPRTMVRIPAMTRMAAITHRIVAHEPAADRSNPSMALSLLFRTGQGRRDVPKGVTRRRIARNPRNRLAPEERLPVVSASEVRQMLRNYPVAATIAVKDIGKARTFYEKTLGFSPAQEDEGGVLYESGSTRFLVYPSQFAGTGKQTAASWQVDDIDKVAEDLRGRGITFEQYDFPGWKTDK